MIAVAGRCSRQYISTLVGYLAQSRKYDEQSVVPSVCCCCLESSRRPGELSSGFQGDCERRLQTFRAQLLFICQLSLSRKLIWPVHCQLPLRADWLRRRVAGPWHDKTARVRASMN